jgi:hypothetical protein
LIHGTKALPRSYQGFADDESLLSVQFVEHQGGRALFTLSVPEAIFPLVKNLLENGFSLVRWLETQNRVQKAIASAHDPVAQQKRAEEYQKYSERILSRYDSLLASGMSNRQAIRETKEYHKKRGSDLTCSMIELMVSERRKMRRKK